MKKFERLNGDVVGDGVGGGVVAPKGAPAGDGGCHHTQRAAMQHLDVATDPVASKEALAATLLALRGGRLVGRVLRGSRLCPRAEGPRLLYNRVLPSASEVRPGKWASMSESVKTRPETNMLYTSSSEAAAQPQPPWRR